MLLMLALPLQAFASASMLGCMMAQPDAMAQMAMVDDEAMPPCHHGESNTSSSQHNCNHCAACYLASALPIPVTAPPAIVPASTRFMPLSAAPFSGFIPDGPERPPRIPRA